VSFDVSADAYLRFMGRYSEPLAVQFADLAGVRRGQRVVDVGCGPGALTAELVSRAGADAVGAVDPSLSFAAAVRERLPGVSGCQRPSNCRSPMAPSTPRWRNWSCTSWLTRWRACGR
jgi:trans-aconitate methyltransferase